MHDVVDLLGPEAQEMHRDRKLGDRTFSDDTLLMRASPDHVGEFLAAPACSARRYGLELPYGKPQLLGIGQTANSNR